MKKHFSYCNWILLLSTILLANSYAANGQASLVLNGGVVNITQGAYLVVDNPAANAITRNSGYITSEGENNRIKWNIGTTAATYTVPWGYSASYIPLTFTTASATGSGYFLFSTYHTGWQNSAQLPTGVINMNGTLGTDHSSFEADRFWKISGQGYTTKPLLSNVVFTYPDAEYQVPNNTITESRLVAKSYNSSNSWNSNLFSSTDNTTNNTVIVSSVGLTDFNDWWVLGTKGKSLYWIAPLSSTSNLSANWSNTPGGTGNAGVPTVEDAAIFDGTKDGNCVMNADLVANSLQISSGYSGIITQGANKITIGNAATFSGGLFLGGTSKISVAGPFTVSGTSFVSTSDTLELKSDYTVSSGSFLHNSGTVKFSGVNGSTQNVNGAVLSDFNNITITNTAASPGVSVESNQNINGVLTLRSNVIFDADGSSNSAIFKLISTGDSLTQDASVAILPTGAQITGKVTVQRFMTKEGANNGRIYRYISSPVQNATVADIQNEIPITGPFTGSSTCSGCSGQSMFAYDETVITDTDHNGIANLDDGFVNFPATSNTETLVPGKGYAMFVRGNLLSSTLWDVHGPVNAGNVTSISLPVAYTSSGQIANDGWNLVGNPFPATIDWNAPGGWTKTNLDASIYITDNGQATRKVATWNGVVGTNGGSQYIAMAQGFWTKANGNGTPSLSANENVKSTGRQTTFFRVAAPKDLLRITMTQGSTSDEAVINFRTDATPGFDHDADALKWKNQSFNFSTISSTNDALAINSWSSLMCTTAIKANVTDAKVGHYNLTFSGLDSFSDSVSLVLNDQFINKSVAITNNYKYAFDITTDPNSLGGARFVLTFNKIAPSVSIHANSKTLTIDYKSNIQWYLNDQLIVGATMPSITPMNSGTYGVVVSTNGCELKGSFPFVMAPLSPKSLQITMAQGATLDNAMINFRSYGTPGLDSDWDNLKLKGPSFNLSTLSADNNSLAVNTWPLLICDTGIKMNITDALPGIYTLTFSGLDSFSDSVSLVLNDQFTNKSFAITNNYKYAFDVTADPNSLGGARFVLTFNKIAPSVTIRATTKTLSIDYKNNVQWYLNDQLIAGATMPSITPTSSGTYSVIVTTGGCQLKGSIPFVMAPVKPYSLQITMAQGAVLDNTSINFRSYGTSGLDPQWDTLKLKGPSFNLSTLSTSDNLLRINTWSLLVCNTDIKVNIFHALPGHYTLTFSGLDSFSDSVSLVLNDQFTKQLVTVTNNLQYPFDISTDPNSSGSSRFLLMFKKTAPPVMIYDVNSTLTIDYKKNIQWYLNDQVIQGATLSSITPNSSGTYKVVVNQEGCELTGSTEYIVTATEAKSLLRGINIFPNPVTNEVFITAETGSIESVVVLNILGEVLGDIQIKDEQGHQSGSFVLKDNPSGLYLLRIVAGGYVYTKKIIKN